MSDPKASAATAEEVAAGASTGTVEPAGEG